MDDDPASPHTADMEAKPWQKRARAAGLTQRMLARLTGRDEKTISMQLRERWGGGVPQHLIAVILAWELMSPEQREAWCAGIEVLGEPNPCTDTTNGN